MAAGFDKNKALLKEGGTIHYGTFSSPEAIADGTINPLDAWGWEETGTLGFVKMGTMKTTLNRSFAEMLADTPNALIRKDLIRQQFAMEAELFQHDPQMISTAWGLELTEGTDYSFVNIGSDMPALQDVGLVIASRLVDDTPVWLAIFAGKFTGEALGFLPSGTDYATHAFKGDATPHPNFTDPFDSTDAKKSYGAVIWGLTP